MWFTVRIRLFGEVYRRVDVTFLRRMVARAAHCAAMLGSRSTGGSGDRSQLDLVGKSGGAVSESCFPNSYWNAGMEHEYLFGLRLYPPFKSYWYFVSQLTVLGGLVPGMIGPAFLLLPLSLYCFRHSRGRKLLLAGAIYAIPAFFNTEIRFLIPALPFFALALGLAMENSWGHAAGRGGLPGGALLACGIGCLCQP